MTNLTNGGFRISQGKLYQEIVGSYLQCSATNYEN